jgi:AmmeMemoRadiSam system protein A
MGLSPDDRGRVLAYARRAVAHAVLHGRPDPSPPLDGPFAAPAGLFVTLKARADGALRGCIGHLVADAPLGRVLARVALSTSREDPRFPPVDPGEVAGLRIEVSLLGPFVRSREPLRDLRPGMHGVRLRLGSRAGLLLPQVATEHGLDAGAFLEAACRKAGLPPDAWRDPAAEVDLFTAEVFGE